MGIAEPRLTYCDETVQHILLLRGINVGSRNRIAMPVLRDLLSGTGFEDVRTYVQSGNVVLAGEGRADDVARRVERLLAKELGLDIAIVARTRAQLAKVVALNPLAKVAKDPKRYQVSFLAERPTHDVLRRVEEAAAANERVVANGREIYAWHPDTIARSRLWALLAGQSLGVTATARNWTTVQKLLELADAPTPS
jgi:uncharacterized protein (DUF1697 family)